MRNLLVLTVFVTLAGCSAGAPREYGTTETPAYQEVVARASLRDALGADKGIATVTRNGTSLYVALTGENLPKTAHAVHVHEFGKCDAPSFDSAGGHWNPDRRKHGHNNPQGAHRGDLPNFPVDSESRGSVGFDMPPGSGELLDADGSSIVIHATTDDYRSDPSGNSGARIACGVFVAS